MKLVECVPNFSEGKDKSKVEAVVSAIRGIDGVSILDVETDADHNRCVLSFVAPPEASIEACFAVAKKARELIDLNHHKGEHPRMGAVDVIPFIPVAGVSIQECVALAQKLGERIGKELDIPVYLYDHAARTPERKDLANVRKGQFEGLKEVIGKDPARTPDFGPNHIHPTAGAVAVGARQQIINFNFNLTTHDMAAGKDVAKRVRASGGGLPAVRAKEIDLAARKQVQISTVLTDYKTTSMRRVYDEVARLAAEHSAKIATTEIVGLLPREALLNFATDTLVLENFNPEVQVLENRLQAVGARVDGDGAQAVSPLAPSWKAAGEVVAAALANSDPTPGGGSAACIAGAMGCGLGEMAMSVSLQSKKLEEANRPKLEQARDVFGKARAEFHRLAGEDAAAFDAFMDALKLPKDHPDRNFKMQDGLRKAAEVPLETARLGADTYAQLFAAAPLALGTVGSDVQCALHLLRCATHCAAENVKINLASMKDSVTVGKLAAELGRVLGKLR